MSRIRTLAILFAMTVFGLSLMAVAPVPTQSVTAANVAVEQAAFSQTFDQSAHASVAASPNGGSWRYMRCPDGSLPAAARCAEATINPLTRKDMAVWYSDRFLGAIFTDAYGHDWVYDPIGEAVN